MAVSAVFPRVQYLASAAQTQFLVPFKFFINEDLVVYQTPAGQESDPVIDKLILNTDYTVTGAGDETGGEITLIVAASLDDVITIERDLVVSRPPAFDFKLDGDFTAAELNENLDKIVMQEQQNETLIRERMLLYPATEQLTAGNIILPKLQANQIWKANGAGNLVGATIDENPDWSTLRSELASESPSAPGSDLIGTNISGIGGSILTTRLQALYDEAFINIPEKVQQNTWVAKEAFGPTNIYTVTTTPSFTPLPGSRLYLSFQNSNTGAATLNPNGTGALPIKNHAGLALTGGEILSGNRYILQNVAGTEWVILTSYEPAQKPIMEAAAGDNFMATPGNMIHHPGIPKIQVLFSQINSSPYTITDLYLQGAVASTTYTDGPGGTATGKVRINFASGFTMVDTHYRVLFGAGRGIGGGDDDSNLAVYERSTTHVKIRCTHSSSSTLHGVDKASIAIFGELA